MTTEEGRWVDEIPDEIPHLFVCDGDGWSALYVDGALFSAGDTANVEEQIRILAGVVSLSTDDFFLGGSRRDDAARTVEEIRTYRQARQERLRQAARLRAEADELTRRAAELETAK